MKKYLVLAFLLLIWIKSSAQENVLENFQHYSLRNSHFRKYLQLTPSHAIIHSTNKIALLNEGNIVVSELRLSDRNNSFGIQKMIKLNDSLISISYMHGNNVNKAESFLISAVDTTFQIVRRGFNREFAKEYGLKNAFRVMPLDSGYIGYSQDKDLVAVKYAYAGRVYDLTANARTIGKVGEHSVSKVYLINDDVVVTLPSRRVSFRFDRTQRKVYAYNLADELDLPPDILAQTVVDGATGEEYIWCEDLTELGTLYDRKSKKIIVQLKATLEQVYDGYLFLSKNDGGTTYFKIPLKTDWSIRNVMQGVEVSDGD